jgi:spore coat polysaccharide biosynthesis protein SpsF (cytidylyltransferase family)
METLIQGDWNYPNNLVTGQEGAYSFRGHHDVLRRYMGCVKDVSASIGVVMLSFNL